MAMLFFEIVLRASKFSFSHCVKQAEIEPLRLNFMAYFMCPGRDEPGKRKKKIKLTLLSSDLQGQLTYRH